MQKLIIVLILLGTVIGGYRFVSSRRKSGNEQPVEITETQTTPTPTSIPEVGREIKGIEATDQDLPSSGISSDEKIEVPSPEEMEAIIKEFQAKE